jgi:hypothetical protein
MLRDCLTDVWAVGTVQGRNQKSPTQFLLLSGFPDLDANAMQAKWAIADTSCSNESSCSVALVRPAVIALCPKLVNVSYVTIPKTRHAFSRIHLHPQ